MCLYEKRGKDCRQRAKYVFQGNWYSDLISFNCIILPHLFSSEWILVVAQKLRLAEAKHSVTGQYQCNQALFSHSGKGENRPCEQSQRSYKTPSQGEGHSYFPKLPPDMQHFLTHSLRFNHEVLQDLSKTQRKERIWIRGAKKKKNQTTEGYESALTSCRQPKASFWNFGGIMDSSWCGLREVNMAIHAYLTCIARICSLKGERKAELHWGWGLGKSIFFC